MKKIFTLSLALISAGLLAQSSIQLSLLSDGSPIAPNSILLYNTTASQKLTVTLDIKNVSSTQKTYDVKRYDLYLNKTNIDTAYAFFCFAGNCYGKDVTVSLDQLVLDPGKSASDVGQLYFTLDADLQEAAVIGYSAVKYTFYNSNDVNDSVQVQLRYNNHLSQGVGIKEASKKSGRIDIYPNPATELTNLLIQGSGAPAKLTVVSSIGQVVYEKELSAAEKNNVQLNVQHLPAGVYFVQLKDGQALTTKKLVIE